MKNLLKITLILFILIMLYAYYVEPKILEVNEYYIINKKLESYHHGLKIVHLSDVHYGTTIKKEELTNVVNKINEIKPDILLFTGDLIDNKITLTNAERDDFVKLFNKIDVNLDSYYIKGHHDHNKEFNNIIDKLNINLITGGKEEIYYKGNNPIELITNTSNLPSDNFSIYLTYKPDQFDKIKKHKPNIVLSSNTHGGIMNLPLLGPLYKGKNSSKYYEKHYNIDNIHFFISSGLGTSKANFRLLNKPSFNLYRLYNK